MAGTIDSAVERKRDERDEKMAKQGGSIPTSEPSEREEDARVSESGGPGEGDSSATKAKPPEGAKE